MKISAKIPNHPNRARGAAFTLLEMLASVTVFILLVLAVSELLSNTTKVTSASRGRLDADTQARMALDRIGFDISRIVNRSDVDFLINKDVGTTINDEMYFYSEVPGRVPLGVADTEPLTGLSLVGFRIGSTGSANTGKLERYSMYREWDEGSGSVNNSPIFLAYQTSGQTAAPLPSTTITEQVQDIDAEEFGVLADGVFRMEVCYLLKKQGNLEGRYSTYPIHPDAPNTVSGSSPAVNVPSSDVGVSWFDDTAHRAYTCEAVQNGTAIWRARGLKDVQAILVTIAVLDTSNLRIVEGLSAGALDQAARSLPKVSDNDLKIQPEPSLPSKIWREKIDSSQIQGIPAQIASSIRVYQRLYYLDSPKN